MQGFIAFFDILGYSSFLENNTTTETAEQILEIITSSGKRTDALMQIMRDQLPTLNKEIGASGITQKMLYASVKENTQWTIFSDSIVLTVNCEPPSTTVSESDFLNLWGSLVIAVNSAGALAEGMFLAGLPVRGVLHHGEYLKRESSLAGRGIIEAYKLCNKLDLAATVVTPSAHSFGKVNVPSLGLIDYSALFLDDYCVPMNNGTEDIMPVITALDLRLVIRKALAEAVFDSFTAHSKGTGGSALRKAGNTIKMWQFVPTRENKRISYQAGLKKLLEPDKL